MCNLRQCWPLSVLQRQGSRCGPVKTPRDELMKRLKVAFLLVVMGWFGQSVLAADPVKLPFDTYSGYFVSNKFEPDAAESFLVITDQGQFDKVFGVAMVMGDKSHRLPKDAFKSNIVLAAIKRGKAYWEFKVEAVTEANGVVELRYTTTEKKSDSATFACPLIVSIPKGRVHGGAVRGEREDGEEDGDRERSAEEEHRRDTADRQIQGGHQGDQRSSVSGEYNDGALHRRAEDKYQPLRQETS